MNLTPDTNVGRDTSLTHKPGKQGEKEAGPVVASMPLEGCGMHFDDPAFLDWLHRKEIIVYFWTIDDPQEVKRLAAGGADGIVTNHPGIAAQALGL